jgi:hypothetical protein
MFDKEWMEYFQRESPLAYYCIILLQYVGILLSYVPYIILLLIVLAPIFMVYFGIKTIKIKLVEDKQRKKIKKEQENYQNMYIDRLDKNLSGKNKKKAK